jgi:hypothetical protein
MVPTMLIQRLRRPTHKLYESDRGMVLAGMSFGGGMKNGGLGEPAMRMLLRIFEFDYMGSSEFEHGAIPKSLQQIAKFGEDGGLELRTFQVILEDIKGAAPRTYTPRPEKEMPVYLVCPKKFGKTMEERARLIVEREGTFKTTDPVRLHDGFHLGTYLKYEPPYEDPVVAGLEIDNHFLISADKELAEKFYELMKD